MRIVPKKMHVKYLHYITIDHIDEDQYPMIIVQLK